MSNLPARVLGSLEPVPGRCGARLRKSLERFGEQRYCERYPVQGRDRCKFHGGLSPRGVEHPLYKGRGYSKDLPTRLADRFETALRDPHLTSLQSELALMDARLGEVLAKLPEGEDDSAWAVFGTLLDQLGTAVDSENLDDARFYLERLQEVVANAKAEQQVWLDVNVIISQRRQLADTERKREELLATTMTARQAAAFVTAVKQAIVDTVEDVHVRRKLGTRLQQLLLFAGDGPVEPEARPEPFETEADDEGEDIQDAEVVG